MPAKPKMGSTVELTPFFSLHSSLRSIQPLIISPNSHKLSLVFAVLFSMQESHVVHQSQKSSRPILEGLPSQPENNDARLRIVVYGYSIGRRDS